jgi:hypothetical protein
MKNLFILMLMSMIVTSCVTVPARSEITLTAKNSAPALFQLPTITATTLDETIISTPTLAIEMPMPEPTPAREGFTSRKFSDEWTRVYQMRSDCIDFDTEGHIWSVFLGLEYFDGNVWVTASTPNEFDTERGCPHVSKDGSIWFFTLLSANCGRRTYRNFVPVV